MNHLKAGKRIGVFLLALTLGLALNGCGKSGHPKNDSSAGESRQKEADSKTPADSEGTGKKSGQTGKGPDLSNTLIYAGENESTINPVLTYHDELTDIIFSGLMKYDGSGRPVVDLAESYEYDAESFTYTFYLREGVKWHDGADFTAEDVVFTYRTLMEDETLSSSLTSDYEDIVRAEAVDDHTVVIELSHYNAAILGYFTMGILPRHLLEGEDMNTTAFNQAPVGTGRFKFQEWDRTGGMIFLVRNEDYYGKVPNIERLIYKTVAVESTKATMLESGEADLAWLNAGYADNFRGREDYHTWDFATADYRGASMDMKSDFWSRNRDSVSVLNYALDKEAIIAGVLKGQGEAAYSPIQKNPLGSNQAADRYPYDREKFDTEMTRLGWAKGPDGIYERNGERFRFTIQTRDYEEERVDIANVMSAMLRQCGVEMEVVPVTRFDWSAGYDGFLAGFATPFDPDMVYKQLVTGASDNTMSYSNEQVDRLLEEGRHTENETERRAIYGEFEEVYAQDPGVLLVAYLNGNYVGSRAVNGLDTSRVLGHHAVGVMWNIEEWTIDR